MEILYDESRKSQMMDDLKNMPKDADLNQKKLKINNLEQTMFLSFVPFYFTY